MDTFIVLLKGMDTLAIILALLVLSFGILAWRSTRNKEQRFDFEELFLDELGRTSLYKLGQFIALCFSTWGFVYLTLAYKLSEWYFTAYMVAWAGANVANKYIETKKPAGPIPDMKKPEEKKAVKVSGTKDDEDD